MKIKHLLKKETTLQELFNHAIRHLLSMENSASRLIRVPKHAPCQYSCVYRMFDKEGKGYNACPLGACIGSGHYSSSMEGKSIYRIIRQYFPEASHLMDLSERIQYLHDEHFDEINIRKDYSKIIRIAQTFGLEYEHLLPSV